ncbi:hypothetical protein L9F63_022179, partial [Diploptera punctata]
NTVKMATQFPIPNTQLTRTTYVTQHFSHLRQRTLVTTLLSLYILLYLFIDGHCSYLDS